MAIAPAQPPNAVTAEGSSSHALGSINVISDTDWSIMRPNDFSLAGEKLNFTENVKLFDSMEKVF